MDALSPSRIMEGGLGFWASKTLLSAVELGLFSRLGARAMTGRELQQALDLSPRANPDFFDALVALRFLDREGDGAEARYRNAPEAGAFLDRESPSYVGGFFEMGDARADRFWGGLTGGVRNGRTQKEDKHTGAPVFRQPYSSAERLEQFMEAMAGISAANFAVFAEKFDFARYRTLCDVGGATGQLSVSVAKQHAHVRCVTVDLPEATAIAERRIAAAGLSDRISARSIDFFSDPLPRAAVV